MSGFPIPVVAAVIRGDDGRILLARRNPGGPHGGLWEFPGGKVEPGEEPKAALAREILEELGAEVSVEERVLGVDHAYPHVRIFLTAYSCQILSGDPQPLGCWEIAWVDRSDLLRFPMPDADVPIARELLARYRVDGKSG